MRTFLNFQKIAKSSVRRISASAQSIGVDYLQSQESCAVEEKWDGCPHLPLFRIESTDGFRPIEPSDPKKQDALFSSQRPRPWVSDPRADWSESGTHLPACVDDFCCLWRKHPRRRSVFAGTSSPLQLRPAPRQVLKIEDPDTVSLQISVRLRSQ